jgi:hypothetical protein
MALFRYYIKDLKLYNKEEFYKALKKEFKEYNVESLKESVKYLRQIMALYKKRVILNKNFI